MGGRNDGGGGRDKGEEVRGDPREDEEEGTSGGGRRRGGGGGKGKKKKEHRLDETFDTSKPLPTIPKIRNLAVNLARLGFRISCPRVARGGGSGGRMIN